MRSKPRLGVKLMVRTTRRITLTHEGSAFLEDCQRLWPTGSRPSERQRRRVKASGYLRITSRPASGAATSRRWCAVSGAAPEVNVSLNPERPGRRHRQRELRLRVWRVGDLPDSSLVSVRLADNRRLCVATPAYLKRGGAGHRRATERTGAHECLTLSSDASRTALGLVCDGEVTHLRRAGARLHRRPGAARLVLAGLGIAWRSTWEVEHEVASGQLVSVLDAFARAAERHLRGVPAREALGAAGAAVDRLLEAQLRRPGVLARA